MLATLVLRELKSSPMQTKNSAQSYAMQGNTVVFWQLQIGFVTLFIWWMLFACWENHHQVQL